MADSTVMQMHNASQELLHNEACLPLRQTLSSCQPLKKIAAVAELHDNIESSRILVVAHETHDIPMKQSAHDRYLKRNLGGIINPRPILRDPLQCVCSICLMVSANVYPRATTVPPC